MSQKYNQTKAKFQQGMLGEGAGVSDKEDRMTTITEGHNGNKGIFRILALASGGFEERS